jgi:hypothetical protein
MAYNVDEESPRNPWGFLICRYFGVFVVKEGIVAVFVKQGFVV